MGNEMTTATREALANRNDGKAESYMHELMEVYGQANMRLLRDTICKGLDVAEMGLFLQVAKSKKLDPFNKEIYAVKRWDSKLQREAMTIQTGVDGFRSLAERTGQYGGQVGPEWCGKDGKWTNVWLHDEPPAAARVGIIRKDFAQPLWQVALWREFRQTKKDGGLAGLWRSHPTVMIAKCAETSGIRRAFPGVCSGLFGEEESGGTGRPARRRRDPCAPRRQGSARVADRAAADDAKDAGAPSARRRRRCRADTGERVEGARGAGLRHGGEGRGRAARAHDAADAAEAGREPDAAEAAALEAAAAGRRVAHARRPREPDR